MDLFNFDKTKSLSLKHSILLSFSSIKLILRQPNFTMFNIIKDIFQEKVCSIRILHTTMSPKKLIEIFQVH